MYCIQPSGSRFAHNRIELSFPCRMIRYSNVLNTFNVQRSSDAHIEYRKQPPSHSRLNQDSLTTPSDHCQSMLFGIDEPSWRCDGELFEPHGVRWSDCQIWSYNSTVYFSGATLHSY